ncbi:Tellurite resistance protein TrgA [Rhodovulum sp. P5]|uniref:TrgA family protein n=1 Tax=Rhodovulum sp. P5 TaxID=1564506 RepID=UPI0009C235A5|nr:TrgA family protein [Rhodovulum sp. P5]ARE39164.1 Tellurite resistance protein TrgA [Rhodovulum sp. P5]
MPTAAKLVATLALAVVAFAASLALRAVLPDHIAAGRMVEVDTALGAAVGWLVMGRLAGRGYSAVVTLAVRSVAVLTFCALMTFAIVEALERAIALRYSDVMEALAGMVELFGDYALILLTAPLALATLLIGGVLAALLTEAVSRRWN